MDVKTLIEKAFLGMEHAYAPYSNFPVGAALLCADGEVYVGCNIEGASFGNTICAERTALIKAISEGNLNFTHLAVCAQTDEFCTPCGICRQMLYEFSPSLIVYCVNKRGEYREFSLKKLLPHAFGSSID